MSAGIAARYATAVFELAKEGGDLGSLEAEVEALGETLDASDDLRRMIGSPVYSREEQARAMAALAGRMNLGPVVTNTLALMAEKRRLFVLPQLVTTLRTLIADAKGEVTADVTSAQPLSKDQATALAATLKKTMGKIVKLNVSVDESLIGGLIVKVGSKMIDTSIRSKLAQLQNAMKEVG